jgi:hypothetical protein
VYSLAVHVRRVTANLPAAVHRGLVFDALGNEVLLKHLGVAVDQFPCVAVVQDRDNVSQRLDGLALAEVVAKRNGEARHFMIFLKPVLEQSALHVGRVWIASISPFVHGSAELFDE